MGDIKSALEIAMEKVEKLEKATDEERLRWQYVPEGEKLGVRYLKEGGNLVVELGKYEEKAGGYIIEGAADILVRNINLPKDDLAKRNNRRAMEGLKNLKSDKVAVENVYSQLRHLFNHYMDQGEQQRKQAYETLKTEFEARVRQAVQQQLGLLAGVKIDVEKQPQFQEEWRKIQTQIDSQYYKLLDEYKQELSAIP
jgi:plasmid stabilization system protein ParE